MNAGRAGPSGRWPMCGPGRAGLKIYSPCINWAGLAQPSYTHWPIGPGPGRAGPAHLTPLLVSTCSCHVLSDVRLLTSFLVQYYWI